MSGRRESGLYLRQLLLEICRMERVTVVYRCPCGERLILANFEPSVLRHQTHGIDVSVLRVTDQVACPGCGVQLVSIWQAAEMAWVEDVLARLASLDEDNLVYALQIELTALEEARLKCN